MRFVRRVICQRRDGQFCAPSHVVRVTHLHPLPLVVRGVLDNGADAVLIDVVFVFWALWMIGRDLDQRI